MYRYADPKLCGMLLYAIWFLLLFVFLVDAIEMHNIRYAVFGATAVILMAPRMLTIVNGSSRLKRLAGRTDRFLVSLLGCIFVSWSLSPINLVGLLAGLFLLGFAVAVLFFF